MPKATTLPRGYIVRNGLLGKASGRADRYATAVHEAGHAVAAHILGARVLELRLYPPTARVWTVRGRHTAEYRRRRGRVDPVERGVVSLAGHEAEVRLCGRPIHQLPASDYIDVLRLGCSASSANALGFLARRLVRWYTPEIRAVARQLNDRGVLTRRLFLQAYRGGGR